MIFKRRRLIQASQAEILRSHQRDNLFVRVLNDNFQNVLINFKYRYNNRYISSETAMELLYFILTHGIGNQTLGEEYTGIVPVKLRTSRVQPLSKMIFVTLTECFGQSFVIRLINYSIKWLNGPNCTFTSEAINYFNNCLQKLKMVMPIIILFHQGIFHITGRYPTIGKRIFEIDYAKVYGKRATQNVNWGIKMLGLIILMQCALRLWQIRFQMSDALVENNTVEQIKIQNKDAMRCSLCLERESTTSTVCGHLFCWDCIAEWLQNQQHCPQCREPMSPSRIVYLMNL